jgi:hypothetical protein
VPEEAAPERDRVAERQHVGRWPGRARGEAERADVDGHAQLGRVSASASRRWNRERGLHGALRAAARARAGMPNAGVRRDGERATNTPPKPATRSAIICSQRRAAVHGSTALSARRRRSRGPRPGRCSHVGCVSRAGPAGSRRRAAASSSSVGRAMP